jgi:hypothetical protein
MSRDELERLGPNRTLIAFGSPRSHPNILFALESGALDPVQWEAQAGPGDRRALKQAARYEFGDLPHMLGKPCPYDTPGDRSCNGRYTVALTPSDPMGARVPEYMVKRAAAFFSAVTRRLLLGVPTERRRPGASLAAVTTRGNCCGSCPNRLPPHAVTCKCGWTQTTGGGSSSEEAYPTALPDT